VDLPALIARISQDAAPDHPGFQAQAIYVALNLLLPLAAGAAVVFALRKLEALLGSGEHGGRSH
jgi:hypothetical protein